MGQKQNIHKDISGWGVDANRRNDPTYPMKNRADVEPDFQRTSWDRPPVQNLTQETLRSIERPTPSAVVGSGPPPSGLSGYLRRYAFRYSESQHAHWIPLLLADRINEWEGIIEDLSTGKIPNIFREQGGRAAWKYNRPAMIRKLACVAIGTGLLCAYLWKRKTQRK